MENHFCLPLGCGGVICKGGVLTPLCSLHDIALPFAQFTHPFQKSRLKQRAFLLTTGTGQLWSSMMYQIQLSIESLNKFWSDPPQA